MKKINNWNDYNKLVKEETYNVAKIEDTYIYQLEKELEEFQTMEIVLIWRDKLERLREENEQLKRDLEESRSFEDPVLRGHAKFRKIITGIITEHDDEDNLEAAVNKYGARHFLHERVKREQKEGIPFDELMVEGDEDDK